MGFKTHIEGGSWAGGGTEVFNCALAERNAIETAFNIMVTRFHLLSAVGLTNLVTSLSARTVATVQIDCRGSGCDGSMRGTALRGGNEINLCQSALPPVGTQENTNATVFHQLVICCGGFELDAWALEDHVYHGHGSTTPSLTTVASFMTRSINLGDGLRAGSFVVWDPASGHLFSRIDTGGSWVPLSTIGRGRELNINSNTPYIFPPR